MPPGQTLSYAVLRSARDASEEDRARVLMIMDTADEAEAVASELRGRGISVEVRAAVGSGAAVRLWSR